jgi:hypothetical protein
MIKLIIDSIHTHTHTYLLQEKIQQVHSVASLLRQTAHTYLHLAELKDEEAAQATATATTTVGEEGAGEAAAATTATAAAAGAGAGGGGRSADWDRGVNRLARSFEM